MKMKLTSSTILEGNDIFTENNSQLAVLNVPEIERGRCILLTGEHK